jgi:hypothetical protein
MKAIHILGALALTTVSALAFGQQSGSTTQQPPAGSSNPGAGAMPGTGAAASTSPQGFSSLDTNADGSLSPTEVSSKPGLQARFADADADRNGSLSNSEFAAFESRGAK